MIVQNKKAYFDYFIEDKFEAGLVLEGWEVKSIRAKKVHITEGYVVWDKKENELSLIGAHITPLITTASHINTDPTRSRKLLLNKSEINKLSGNCKIKGYTIVPLDLHFKNGRIKLTIGLAKGKKQYDKRASEKERDSKKDVMSNMKRDK